MVMKILLPVLLIALVGLHGADGASQRDVPDMIVILVDGFRWDYTEIHKGLGLPGFDHLSSAGVRAKYLNPVFPPNSFPNWHTIVTGLYPESHGIVSNFMYDSAKESKFDLYDLDTTKDPEWWSDAEPLWITTTKDDINTALFYWSRCDVAWDGVLPKYCVPYDFNAANSHYFVKQLHQALDMIQGEDYQLIMLYTGGVDRQGHYYGPDSAEVAASVGEVDAVLQGLWEALETREMYNSTNVVILSDHGMTYTLPKDLEFVDIAPCIDRGQLLSTTEYGSYVNILPAPGYEQQVAEDLRKCPDIKDKVEVYLKDELDERYHYRSHRLIHEIMVIAKPGVYIRAFDEAFAVPAHAPIYVADHGYDNTFNQNPNMRGILYATGPSFAKGVEVGPVEQVDVYGLLCRALQLSSCHPHNGTMSRVEDFFMKTETSISPTFWEFSLVAFTLLFSLFILSLTSVLWR
ncbi:glycerophosphocholine cholinephosphodiesterase ENPP6-like [Macrobrachium rosenbergii]|uniref:glycerophosphocholine cholinephosphodiesterase ENPP6-like n=1 Tax=Macrobrachium rosenbergii TaxID=79674 RepID=UPI0034D5BCF5